MADRGVRPTWKATPFGHITQEQCDAFEARMNATAATVQDDDTPLIVVVKPWSRKTHKLFPAPARARAVELVRWGFRFSRLPHFQRQGKEQPMFELWMTKILPHEIVRSLG